MADQPKGKARVPRWPTSRAARTPTPPQAPPDDRTGMRADDRTGVRTGGVVAGGMFLLAILGVGSIFADPISAALSPAPPTAAEPSRAEPPPPAGAAPAPAAQPARAADGGPL
jgi:hypothetical protein